VGTNIALGAFLPICADPLRLGQRFYPDRLAAGIPRIFEYFGTSCPDLQWDVLFEGRTEDGRAVPGSLTSGTPTSGSTCADLGNRS
jgi:phosphonate transport system permease protein